MSEMYNPVWVILDGENLPFASWMTCEEVDRIKTDGWKETEKINLREIDNYPVPQSLKEGFTMIKDIWSTIAVGPGFKRK